MSNSNKHLLFSVFLLLAVLLYRYIFIDSKPQQAPVNSEVIIASIQESIAPYQQKLDSSLAVIEHLTHQTLELQDSLGRANAIIRRQPPRYIQVPVIQVAECDSARIVGRQISKENEALQIALKDCKELASIQDTAIQELGAELQAAESRHQEDQKHIIRETDRKKFWRTSAFVLLVKTAIDEFRIARK